MKPKILAFFGLLKRHAHRHRRFATSLIYGSIAGFSYLFAYGLRFEFELPSEQIGVMFALLPVVVAVRVVVALSMRLGTGSWRFVSVPDLLRLFAAMTVGSLVLYGISWGLPLGLRVPRSILVVEWLLSANLTAGVWVGYRLLFEYVRHREHVAAEPKRVLVVGAGVAGQMLVREMLRFPTGRQPVGFVDDDPFKQRTFIHGVEVLGRIDDIPEYTRVFDVQEVLIAIPSATPVELRRVVEICEDVGCDFRLLPGIREVIDGDASLGQLREVRVEDLLGRNPIQLELPELTADLAGEAVLITGAAGSIGSELARQVALHGPRCLILLDQAETSLYFTDIEIRNAHPDLEVRPQLVDVTDKVRLERVFEMYRPSRVFHAAAYKHVPMIEAQPDAAVQNNILGTWLTAKAAGKWGAERFILVSTDKAVRPANVMGASKRVSELLTLHLQDWYPKTAFGAVRFGNVLGSNGSVIPLFKRQLEAGEPLTVTHENVTRFFMTIPEAVQLILQASLLPRLKGGIAMLEMGEPVRILELARNLLRLSGKGAQVGRDIVITGLRPGEKLHEELAAPEEKAVPTGIDKVNLLDTSSSQLPTEIANAIDEGRFSEIMAYLMSEVTKPREAEVIPISKARGA